LRLGILLTKNFAQFSVSLKFSGESNPSALPFRYLYFASRAATRVFNRPELLGRHDFQARKFGRQCTKSGSHAGLQEKSSKNV